ncbi:MAG: MFS transporter [Lachnospiraceae bacterium]|nr:MFS transporter [Lachnospiraceae bacterium]
MCIYLFRNWILVNPFNPFLLEEINTACQDTDGNLYVIDKAGERLLKIDPNGVLQWKITASGSNFEKAVRVCADKQGHIYIQDRSIRSGIRLQNETVLQYSTDGVYEKTVFRRGASEDQIRPSIIGISISGDVPCAFITMDDRIVVRELLTAETTHFPLDHADELVLNAAWDYETKTLWYCTFNGRIFRYEDGEKDTLLYDNSKHVEEIESTPRAVSCLNGTVYAADRGLRCVNAIDDKTGEVTFLTQDIPWEERELCDNVTSDYSVVSVTESVVKIWDGDQCEEIGEAAISTRLKKGCVLLWICLMILCVSIIAGLIKLAIFLLTRASAMIRIVTMILIGVVALSGMLVGTLFPNFSEQLLAMKFEQAEFSASTTTKLMPIAAFLNLDESSDYLGEDYLAVQDAVNSVFKSGSETTQGLYCTFYRVLGDHNTITLTYSMDENSMLLPYDWEYEGSDEQEILTTGVGKQYVNRSVEGSYLFILNPVTDENGTPVGLIEVGTDLRSFERENRKLLMDLFLNLIAVTAVSVMFFIEIVYFIRGRREAAAHADAPAAVVPAGVLRMIVFLVFFFTNLTTAILPVHAMKLASLTNLPGLSSEFLAAIPLSAEVVSGAVFSVLGANMIRKLSLKRSVLLCAILFTAGLALRIVPNYWLVTLGSIVIGIGWGVILLVVNTTIAVLPGDEKDTGFAYYNAAALNGVNSGTVFGGFLLNWVPHIALFAITAVGSIALFFMVRKYLTGQIQEEEEDQQSDSSMSFLKFLLSPNILTFFLMLVVPVLIGSYFLIYMFPIIGTRWGLSETYVGYSYLLNGLCVMALSTTMTNLFTHAKKKRLGLTISALLYALSFAIVAIFHSVLSLLVALIVLGISDSFGLPLQTSFYTDQKEVERFGFDRSLGVYSLFENISQSLGPFVFSWILVIGVSKGLMVFSSAIVLMALAFLFVGLFFRSAGEK